MICDNRCKCMRPDAAAALQIETDFLSGVEMNIEAAKGGLLRGKFWKRAQHDEGDRLRALMAEKRMYDRELLKSLPTNRRVALHAFDRSLLFWRRRTGVATASVLAPLGHYISDDCGDAPPIGLGELAEHVRRVVGDAKVPHLVGVCSPSGFTDEARSARLDMPNVTVVLVEPDGHGGWNVEAGSEDVDPRVLRMFDPEGTAQKIERVNDYIEAHRTDLLTGAMSASSVAKKVSLGEPMVQEAFARMAKKDGELRLSRNEGDFLLYRGAPTPIAEKQSMSVIDRIKQLFSGDGDDVEKMNVLMERRAALAQRRDKIYEEIGILEKKEADLLKQGREATSAVPRRRLAAQLAQLRKDIGRQNTTAKMLNQQVNILSTNVHNLTLIQQGEMAKLPDTEELTENAVRAEEMLETLQADSELVGGLENDVAESMTSDEELAILSEFEAADAPVSHARAEDAAATKAPAEAPREKTPESSDAAPTSKMADSGAFEPPQSDKTPNARPADPEAS